MLVAETLAASTSPSPTKVPEAIATVALTSWRLSGSDTVTLGESVMVVPTVKLSDVDTLERVGASLTAVMVTVVVAGVLVLNDPAPSLSTQGTWRGGEQPEPSGLFVGV